MVRVRATFIGSQEVNVITATIATAIGSETDCQAEEILKLSTIYFITTTEHVTLSWYNSVLT